MTRRPLGLNELHRAVFDRNDPGVVESILRANPELVRTPDNYGRTPIQCFFRTQVPLINTVNDHPFYRRRNGKLLDVAFLLMKAHAQGHLESPEVFRVLHASLELGSPWKLVGHLLRQRPTRAGETDESGNYPLHLACEHRTMFDEETFCLLVRECPGALVAQNAAGETPLHVSIARGRCYGGTSSLRLLLRCATEAGRSIAGIPDATGKLPLHLALENGKTWSGGDVRLLLRDAPRALAVRDVSTRLYPFMVAAVGGSNGSDLTTVYELLRANPTMAYGLADTPERALRSRLEAEEAKSESLETEVSRLRAELARTRNLLANAERRSEEPCVKCRKVS